jgi:hypothetical protein
MRCYGMVKIKVQKANYSLQTDILCKIFYKLGINVDYKECIRK